MTRRSLLSLPALLLAAPQQVVQQVVEVLEDGHGGQVVVVDGVLTVTRDTHFRGVIPWNKLNIKRHDLKGFRLDVDVIDFR